MSSERQIEANRLNAQRSTGPRSPEGKQRVGLNALKHGLTARQIVIPTEDPTEFEAFREAFWRDLDPQGALEEVVVAKITVDAWRLRRIPWLEAALHRRAFQESIIEELIEAVSSYENTRTHFIPASDQEAYAAAKAKLKDARLKLNESAELRVTRALENQLHPLANLQRHEETMARSMLRMLHELQRLQAMRAGEPVVAPAVLDVNINYDSPENCES
jgi:hypothetical protein